MDAIKENLFPNSLTQQQIQFIYDNEADVLNVALFGVIASKWRDGSLSLMGNRGNCANVHQLVCLASLEPLNTHFIEQSIQASETVVQLNVLPIRQIGILTTSELAIQSQQGVR